MDKLKALYESYIEKGLLSSETTFEQFSSASSDIQDGLYNQGVENKIISSSTDVNTFKSAWAEKKNPIVTPSDGEEVLTESTTETEVQDGVSDSLEVNEVVEEGVINESQLNFGDQTGPIVEEKEEVLIPDAPNRKGVLENKDGSVSTHKMRTETDGQGNWFSFPTIFQNEDGSFVDMSEQAEQDWESVYKEAKKRGEVVDFLKDKESAIAYGEGSWKERYNSKKNLLKKDFELLLEKVNNPNREKAPDINTGGGITMGMSMPGVVLDLDVDEELRLKIESDPNIQKALSVGYIKKSDVTKALKGDVKSIEKLQELSVKSIEDNTLKLQSDELKPYDVYSETQNYIETKEEKAIKQNAVNAVNAFDTETKTLLDSNPNATEEEIQSIFNREGAPTEEQYEIAENSDYQQTGFEDEDLGRMYNQESLKKLSDKNDKFSIAGFNGYLNKKGFKERYNQLLEDETIAEDGTSYDYTGNYNPTLAAEKLKYDYLKNYLAEADMQRIEKEVLDYKIANNGKNPFLHGDTDKINLKPSVSTEDLGEYMGEEFKSLAAVVKKQKLETKENYQTEIEGGSGGSNSQWIFDMGSQGGRSIDNRANSFAEGAYGWVGMDSFSDEIQMNQAETELNRDDMLRYTYASGRSAFANGREYLIDDRGEIYDLDLKIRVSSVLEPEQIKEIKKQVQINGVKTSSFSGTGAAVTTAGVASDMLLQIALTRGVGMAGQTIKGIAAASKYKQGRSIISLLEKVPMKASTASAMIAQGTLMGTSLSSDVRKQALAAGMSNEEANELASSAGMQGYALGVITAPISTQKIAMDKIFGTKVKEKLIQKTIDTYARGAGIEASKNIFKKGLDGIIRTVPVYFKEGAKEFVQENIQQAGQAYVIGSDINEQAGQEIMKDTISMDDFMNTSIISLTAGMLMPFAGDVQTGAVRAYKMRGKGFQAVDQMKSLALMANDSDKTKQLLDSQVKKGVYTQEQVDNVMADVDIYRSTINGMPPNLSAETSLLVMSDLAEIKKLEAQKASQAPSFAYRNDAKIQQLKNRIIKNSNFDFVDNKSKQKLMDEAAKELVAEKESSGEKNYSIDNSQIRAKAVENFNKLSPEEMQAIAFPDQIKETETKTDKDAIQEPSTEEQVLPNEETSGVDGAITEVGLQQVGEGVVESDTTQEVETENVQETTDKASDTTTETDTEQLADTPQVFGDNPLTSIEVSENYNDIGKQRRDKLRVIAQMELNNEITTEEQLDLREESFRNMKKATESFKSKTKTTQTDTTSETEVMSVNKDNKIESFANRLVDGESTQEFGDEAQQFYAENQSDIDELVTQKRKDVPKNESKTRRLATKIANGDTNFSNEQIDLYASNEADVKAEVESISKTNSQTVTEDTYKSILKSVKSTTRTDKAKQEGENAQRKRFWKSWNKSARLAKKDLKTKRKELNDQIKTYAKGKKGTITAAQTRAVVNKVNSVNLDNELAVQELIDYSEKVFNNADFAVKEQLAIKLNKQVTTRLNKGNYGLSPDIVSRLTTILNTPIKQLTSENIDSYNDFLSNLKKQKENVRVDEQLVIDSQNMADALYVEGNQYVDEEVETKKTKTLKSVVDKIINEDVDGETLISEDSKFIENDLDKLDSFTLQTLIDKINNAETDENQELVQAANDFAENRQKALTRIKSRSKGISLKSLDNTTKEAGDVDVFKNIKDSDLIGLTGKQLDLLEITLENINDGHYTHAANKLGQSVNSRAYNMRPMIAKYGKLKNKIGMFRGRAAASLKSTLKGSKSTPSLEIARSNPLSVIDNAFGNFDNNTIRNNSFEPTATKYSAFKTFTGRLTDKLDAVEKIIAPTLKEGTNPAITRRFEITTYLLAKEYESNKGNDGVAEANAFIDKTIEKFNDVNSDSNYTQADIDILLAIKKKYSDNGVITSKKMDESLSPKVKKAIKLLEEVYGALGDKQAYATSIVRGNKLDLLNNYVHHKVDAANDKDDSQLLAQKTYFAPSTSTESKTSIGRTKGAKAIDFDPVSTALRGLRATGLDFFLTNEIQTSRKAFGQLTKISQENNASEDVIEATQSLSRVYNESIENVLASNFSTDVIGGKYFDMAKRVGYYSTLASVPRSVAELGSNLTFGLLDSPLQLMQGMTKYGNLSLMQNGLSFAENVGSTTVSKNWGSEILGGSKAEQGGVVRNKKPAKRASNSNLKSSLQYGKRATDTFGKGVELLADTLLSTPDKMISRPLFFGTFAKTFKQETGQDMDVDKISNNDQEYMTKYADAIKAAKIAADKKVTQAATSNDPFSGVLKNQLSDTDNGFMIYYKTINSYMSRFSINEFATARQAVASMIGQGEESAIKGGAKLAGVMTRMSLYVVMYKAFASMFNGMLGLDDEDETDYKELGIRQLAGAGVSLITRGASGNVPMIPINYGIELLNEEYGEQLGLWSDKDGKGYNSFKHSIIFSVINQQSLESKGFFKSAASVLAGPLSPQVMAAGRIAELLIAMKAGGTAGDKAAKKFFSERTAIEAAGIVGAMPFYKDLRRYFMAEDWSKIKEAKAANESDKGLTYEELKIFNPRAAEKLKRDKKSANKKYKSTSAYRKVKAMEDKLKKFK
jgi:hypothetical protein